MARSPAEDMRAAGQVFRMKTGHFLKQDCAEDYVLVKKKCY